MVGYHYWLKAEARTRAAGEPPTADHA
jgi:hypothetical protein